MARLRVMGERLDPLVTRLRVASLIESADTTRAGLPPSSILCIRRLPDPLPGSLNLHERSLTAPPAWRSAFAASIRALGVSAVRPLRGGVGPDAQSVIFSDTSELLASLAQDWCEGLVARRWWWASLYKDVYPDVHAPRAWAESPEYIPAALEHLAVNQRLAPFANALSAADARSLLEAVTRGFALHDLRDALHDGFRDASLLNADDADTRFDTSREKAEASFAGASAHANAYSPPWRQLAPEVSEVIAGRARQCLLGVGLALRRAYAFARTPDFARATLRWLETIDSTTGGPPASVQTSGPHSTTTHDVRVEPRVRSAGRPERKNTARDEEPHQRQHDAQQAFADAPPTGSDKARVGSRILTQEEKETAPGPGAPVASAMNRDTETTRDPETHRHAVETPEGDVSVSQSSFEEESRQASVNVKGKGGPEGSASEESFSATRARRGEVSGQRLEASAVSSEEARLDGSDSTRPASSSPSAAPEASGAPEVKRWATVRPDAKVETEFGGLFYLVNVGLFLELYADFTSPLEGESPLPLFDFVGLLGERLLGARVKDDPVWQLLAGLSARGEGGEPGEDFAPPGEWRIPTEWLQTFPEEGAWLWSEDAGRLRVRHPEGFLVLDVPIRPGEVAAEKLGRELEAYRACAPFTLSSEAFDQGVENYDGLAWWLDRLTPYVIARLRRALGVADANEAARLLCERRARVFVTASHLDVVFALAELPIEVRLSGLDRNPGWVPAAGRFVAFHYE